MKQFKNYSGKYVQLTSQREAHILYAHPEMQNQDQKIRETISNPDFVIRSRSDDDILLYYRDYENTPVTQKYMCVVVKDIEEKKFIITAYFSDHLKKGESMGKDILIWYDKEADYLEVLFERKEGYFTRTDNDAVMEKVDKEGNLIGFSILKFSSVKKSPLEIQLSSKTG